METNTSVDDTATKGVVVDATADLWWQPEEGRVDSIGSRTTVKKLATSQDRLLSASPKLVPDYVSPERL